MKSKLEKLQLELEKLRKERFNARKVKEHHAREMKKAVEAGDLKDYEKHNVKHQFHSQSLESIRSKILIVKEKLKAEELRLEAEKYQKTLIAFDSNMAKKLSVLRDALRLLVDKLELTDISKLGNELYDFFTANSKGINRSDLLPYHMLGPLSIKIRCSHIVEEYGEMERITSIRGVGVAAQKKQNVITWSSQLASQIEDCIKSVTARHEKESKSLLSKLRVLLCIL